MLMIMNRSLVIIEFSYHDDFFVSIASFTTVTN